MNLPKSLMINVTVYFDTDLQEFKSTTSERINKIDRLILENVAAKMKQKIWNKK